MREPLPIMPRTVSVSVVQVRLSPTSVSNGSRYWVNGSFHSNSHFMATAPKRSTNAAMILPQPGKRDYEWMSRWHRWLVLPPGSTFGPHQRQSRPTGWHSAAASAWHCCQNATDLVREAVSCNAGLGGDGYRM